MHQSASSSAQKFVPRRQKGLPRDVVSQLAVAVLTGKVGRIIAECCMRRYVVIGEYACGACNICMRAGGCVVQSHRPLWKSCFATGGVEGIWSYKPALYMKYIDGRGKKGLSASVNWAHTQFLLTVRFMLLLIMMRMWQLNFSTIIKMIITRDVLV